MARHVAYAIKEQAAKTAASAKQTAGEFELNNEDYVLTMTDRYRQLMIDG